MQKIICGGLQHPIEGEELGSVVSTKNWISFVATQDGHKVVCKCPWLELLLVIVLAV